MRKKWQTHNMYVHVRPPVHVHMHAVVFRVSVLAHASLLTTIFHQLAQIHFIIHSSHQYIDLSHFYKGNVHVLKICSA